jgi:hypothetical protein
VQLILVAWVLPVCHSSGVSSSRNVGLHTTRFSVVLEAVSVLVQFESRAFIQVPQPSFVLATTRSENLPHDTNKSMGGQETMGGQEAVVSRGVRE